MNIFIAETISELRYILKKKKNIKKFKVIALDLDVLTFCKIERLPYFDLNTLLRNSDQINILRASNRLVAKISSDQISNLSQKKIIKDFLRKKFFAAAILNIILKKIETNFKYNKIYISGWEKKIINNKVINFYNSKIIRNFFPQIKIISLEKKKLINDEKIIDYRFTLPNFKKTKKKVILFTSPGYNLGKIMFQAVIKNFKVIVLINQHIALLKRVIFCLLGIIQLNFKKERGLDNTSLKLTKLNFKFNGKDYSLYLNDSLKEFYPYLKTLMLKCSAIKTFLNNNKIDFIISAISRYFYGFFAEYAYKYKKKTQSICISHGTVAEAFNKNDKIYKNIIKEAVFDGKFNYFTIQSKICNAAGVNKYGKKLVTGNLIFENENKNKNPENILYAVTYKSFINLQIFGVDLFYEFYDNLKFLDKFSKENLISVIVNLHPNVPELAYTNLKQIFTNLIFKKEKIGNSLKDCFVCISFSSSVIEDCINSKTPVILFDRSKRYRHCKSEKNFKKLNQPIYYIDDEKKLILTINTIKNSKKINFSKVSYEGLKKNNINKFLKFIKIHNA